MSSIINAGVDKKLQKSKAITVKILFSHDIKTLNVSTMLHHTDLTEEWLEHIISQHNVTLVASAGNNSYVNVLLLALLHNAIVEENNSLFVDSSYYIEFKDD